jgi:hypothetical protein
MMSERLFAPSGVLATSPKATASQVRARVTPANMPAAATHSTGVAVGRNPSASATATTSTPLTMVRMKLPRTWPVSTEARVMAMVRNRAMMPSLMSVQMPTAVDAAPAPAVIKKMPGAR